MDIQEWSMVSAKEIMGSRMATRETQTRICKIIDRDLTQIQVIMCELMFNLYK
jgi:hypothetical protein